MAWLPSHQELRDHPKLRKAARRADVPIPAMIGHLHLLWWWALDHAPDGDLSRFDAEDIADAAMWEGDPDAFVDALRSCGPGGTTGFIDADGALHDWQEYGGKYGKRVEAAKRAAAARWQPDDDADALRTHSEGNADASTSHGNRNAEERRGEERTTATSSTGVDEPDVSEDARQLTRLLAERVKANGHKLPQSGTAAHRRWLVEVDRLLRIDDADPDEVRRVIEWACADEFWAATLQSAPKLREKFSQLRLQSGVARPASRAGPVAPVDRFDPTPYLRPARPA